MSEQIDLTDYADSDSERDSEWIEKRLGEIFDSIYSGGTPKKGKDVYYGGNVPFVKIEDLNKQQGDGVTTAKDYITEQAIEETSTRAFNSGTLLMTIYGSLAETAIVQSRVATNQGILGLWDADEDNVLYVRYAIDNTQPKLASLSRQTTQANLGKGIIKKHKIPIPPLSEQRKIATILYTVDQAIEKTEEIIEQAETLKSGIIQHVFEEGVDQHTSYFETKSGKIPADWKMEPFKNIIEDTRYGTDTKSNINRDGYPTLRIPNVVDKRITLTDLKHTPLDDSELERLKLEEDDILVIRTNGNPDYVGRCATFSERDEPFVFASYLIRIRVDESLVRPKYVRDFLNSRRGRSEMAGWIRSSAGNYNLSVGAIEKFQIPIPPLEEQDMIIEQIEGAEEIIDNNRRYRDRLQRLKQGLMQDLLSGTVRTTDTNITVPNEVAQHG